MRRLPPQQIQRNLGYLLDLVLINLVLFILIYIYLLKVPSLCEDLLSSVDQPLKVARDQQTGKEYLLCDYNRDGDSFR